MHTPSPVRRPFNRAIALLAVVANAQAAVNESSADAVAVLSTVTVQGQRDTVSVPTTTEPVQVLSGPSLQLKVASTLGATLQDELGVANASFGPNVGLPVVRGQGGTRVRALVGGMGTNDASSISADHGVMVEPALADSITVWRGPAAIRFGGAALGGAVDVDDGRIPENRPHRLLARGELRARDQAQLGVLRLDGPAGATTSWHLDTHLRQQGATRVPGFAIDEDAVRQQFYVVNKQNTAGYIDNTDARSEGGALGGGWWGDSSQVGVSVSTFRQGYGIPTGGHSHPQVVEPGAPIVADKVRIEAQQQRWDIKGAWYEPLGSNGTVKWRVVHSDYQHDELAGRVVQTTFLNKVDEGRADWEHKIRDGWTSTVGLHAQNRLFSALGEEAFVPPTRVRSLGAYLLQAIDRGVWRLEAGARGDVQWSTPTAAQATTQGVELTLPDRRFNPWSFSMALSRKHDRGVVSLTHWRVSRAPDVQELYALGPHLATLTYDMGNSALSTETLKGWDLGLEQRLGIHDFKLNAFRYDSDDYIYQRNTNVFYAADEQQFRSLCARLDQCLPVTSYEQAPARLHGYEASWTVSLGHRDRAEDGVVSPWRIGLFADMVQGRLKSGEDLPRMPPRRWGLRLDHVRGPWVSEWRLVRMAPQRRAGANETETDGSVQLNGSLRWTQQSGGRTRTSYFVTGRNLTNQEVRNSTSFLRNYAPEPGRTVELGLEVQL